jgi:hypothetical protein
MRNLARFQETLVESVQDGYVSVDEANEFIDNFNKYVDWKFAIDYIPETVDLTLRGSLDIQFETTITVPFIHCEEDVDEQIRLNFESNIAGSTDDPDRYVSISDIRITDARVLE